MKILNIIIISLLLILLTSTILFNDKIKEYLYKNSIERFAVTAGSDTLGLKWIFEGDIEPDGDKINNEKLYILLNYKYVTPVVLSQTELNSLAIPRLTHDSYINVDGRFFKPYDSSKVEALDVDIGLKWRNLGKQTESYVEDFYTEIKSESIKAAIEAKVAAKAFETIGGEDIVVFTRYEHANMKADKANIKLTYDSYIKVGVEEFIYQPYYEVKLKKRTEDVAGLNLDDVLSNGLDNSFLRSSGIKTDNMRGTDYYSTDIYDNKGVSNIEVSLSNQTFTYKQSNDDMRDSIVDQIDDKYLPYNDTSYDDDATHKSDRKINEYVIINVYKNLLDRQPKPDELIRNLQEFYEKNSDEEKLRMKIYNSTEYKMNVKMQSNDIEPGLITHISETKLIDTLTPVYKEQFNKEPPFKMLIPLKQCYIHLQYNDYLFKAMIMHDNFDMFEKAILREYIMNDQQLLDVFNKYFVLYELRLIANELKRRELLKRKALLMPIALQTEASKNAAGVAGAAGATGGATGGAAGATGGAAGAATGIAGTGTMDSMETEKHIAEIMKNDKQTININITLDENDRNRGGQSGSQSDARENSDNNIDSCDKLYSYIGPKDGSDNNCGTANHNRTLDDIRAERRTGRYSNDGDRSDNRSGDDNYGNDGDYDDEYSDGYSSKKSDRIYDPITYKQQYRGPPQYRPNVCSYGTKQVVNPVFLNSSTLFQGTDLKESIENTQVGSIMPKFEYREYEDVPRD
jgi:hypothetical protein